MSFECSAIESGFGEENEIQTTVDRTAMKSHECGECQREIHQGEIYTIDKILCDGSWGSYKTCCDCKSIRDAFFYDYVFGTILEVLQDSIVDCDGVFDHKAVVKLTPRGKEMYFVAIEEAWEILDEKDERRNRRKLTERD